MKVVSAGSAALRSLLVKWTVPTKPAATLPKASSAVTVKVWDTPAVVAGKPLTVNEAAAAAVTTIPDCVTLSPALAVSATVSDCVPTVFRVALKYAPPRRPP